MDSENATKIGKATNKVKFGWHTPSFPVDGSGGAQFVEQIAEILGRIPDTIESAWIDDHFFPWASWQSPETPYLECATTMSYLAGAFPKLKFASSVFCQSYRNPGQLAKMVATLQVLTHGRLIFGVGAGWMERESLAYDYEFPSPAVRLAQPMEDTRLPHLARPHRPLAHLPPRRHRDHRRLTRTECRKPNAARRHQRAIGHLGRRRDSYSAGVVQDAPPNTWLAIAA